MSNKYTDVMIDIETLGTSPGAPIMEIGAVVFNANTDFISKKYTFRSTLDSEAQIRDGFISRKDTIDWWQRTNPSLYKGLRSSSKDYKKVAEDFEKWFKKIDSKYSPVRLWGNSARFDIGILEAFYKKIRGNSFEPFWSSWNERCVRTIFNIDSGVRPTIKFEGTPHDPIDDATHQIKVLQAIIKKHKLVIT